MESAVLDQVTVDIGAPDGKVVLRATGSTIVFDGFLTLYQEGRDDSVDEDGGRLPAMKERDPLDRGEVRTEQHFTQPPPRYSEASLVKRLEELGIGRPSTYASTLQVLQDRSYVRLDKRRLVPEDRGRVVTAFLTGFFQRYVEYNFTADLENQLDEISGGRVDWKQVLRDFWRDFNAAVADTKDLSITQVIDELDKALGEHFFPPRADGADPRLCPACQAGRLNLKLGKFGAFIGCSNYPNCRYTRRLGVPGEGEASEADAGPKMLGEDPASGLTVSLRKGPYGHYVQLGEPTGEGKKQEKPKRVSLPRGLSPADVTREIAIKLLALPRDIGPHPETGEMIVAGVGRFGPYLKHAGRYKSLGKDDNVLDIGINRAVALLAEAPGRSRGPAGRKLGDHPADKQPVTIHAGRYGQYVKHGRLNATLPRDQAPEEFTLEQAVALLAERAVKKGGKRKALAEPVPGAAPAGKRKAKAKPKAKSKAAAKRKAKAKQAGNGAADDPALEATPEDAAD